MEVLDDDALSFNNGYPVVDADDDDDHAEEVIVNPAAAAAEANDGAGAETEETRRNSTINAASTSGSRKRKSRDGEEEEEEPNVLGIYMMITEEERRWALTLKEALKDNEETKDIPLSDMEIVQVGIVERGGIVKSLDRIKKIHEFRTKYNIKDDVEDGVECVRKFMEQQPGMLLNIDLCARHKHYVQVMDYSRFHPGRVRFEKDWKVLMSGMHYLMVSLHPTLSAVRNGLVGICEFEGMGWHNFDMDFERRMWHEHPTAYPARWHEISWVNTPTAANMFFALLKPLMPAEIRRVFHLGVKFDEEFDGRLDELFLQPNYEQATERVLSNIRSFLTRRYHNEANFRL